MKVKIALLVKEHFAEYCSKMFTFENQDREIFTRTYETFDELTASYRDLLGKCDAVITSGPVPYIFLRDIAAPEAPILGYFIHDIENIYGTILRESIKRNHFDLSRIGMDVLPPEVSLKQAIEENSFPSYIKALIDRILSSDPQKMEQDEYNFSQYYKKMVEQGKLDYILTGFYSVVASLQPYGIDCYYLYPCEKEFYRVIDAVFNQVRLRQQEKSAPAVVHLTLRPINASEVGVDLRISELHTALLEYIKSHQYNISVKQGNQYFHLYTDVETLERITQGFLICPLTQSIPLVEQLCSAVGYGTGNSFFQATQNAVEAAQTAMELSGESKASYYIDGKGNLTALSHEEFAQQPWMMQLPKDQLLSLAGQANLSVNTIAKILNVLHAMGTDQITSQDLMTRLGLSLRTANRYLSNLTNAGLAQAVGTKAMVKKGRPVTLYSLEALTQNLLPEV